MSTVTIPLGASIQDAINANPAGTIFQLAAGTYYGEQFEPLSNDQFIGDPSGGTILSGAMVLSNWTQSGGCWVDSGLPSQSVGQSISGSSPLASDRNDLFINNVLYTPVSSLSAVTAGTWYFDTATNSAYISANPTGQTVTLSVTPGMTYNNGATGVVFKNLTTQQYATEAQCAPIQTGTDWSVINVTSTQNHGAGLYIGGPGTVVQGGSYNDNGQIGIDGSSANGSKVLGAQIDGNNYAGYNTGWDAGGIKVTATDGLMISGDTVDNNNGQGIWADIDSSNWTVSDNTVANNSGNGIMYEISHGATSINNNTVTDNSGSGIYISNSDGVNAFDNTVTVNPSNVVNGLGYGSGGGIDIINNSGRGNDPSGTPYQSINDNVHNNVIIHPGDSAEDGISIAQALPSNANDVFNSNTYYVSNASGTYWHFNNTDYTWSALQQSGTFETNGMEKVGLPTPSPNDTVVLAGSSAAITDASGNVWTITSGGQVATNNTPDTLTSNVVKLAYVKGTIWEENSSNLWRGETEPNDSWAPSAGTATSPLPAASTLPPSPNGSIITSVAASPIIDAAGNAWSLVQSASNGLQIAVNGVVQPITANVVLLETLNGNMVQKNAAGLWFSETGPTGTWENIPAPPTVVSPNGSIIVSAKASPIMDAAGNAWSLVQSASNGLQIAVDGVVEPITANVVLLETLNGNMVQKNAAGLWFSETGPTGTWKNVPAAPQAVSPNGTRITSATASPIIDKAGNAWSVVQSASSGLQIAVDGIVDPITANVVLLETLNGNMVQENTAGFWYTESGPTGTWKNIPPPTIDVTNTGTGATTAVSGVTIATTKADGATFVLTAPGVAAVTLGTTAVTLKFTTLSAVTLTGGTAAATITADGGTNIFTGGTGALVITSGVGADAYIYHAGDGKMTLESFSFAKGDSLTVDKSLQGSMKETSDGHGGLLVGFGASSPGLDLVGVTSITASQIHFV